MGYRAHLTKTLNKAKDLMKKEAPTEMDTVSLKVPLTPKFFISRQKSPFCSDHIGEKIIVVRFFLDFL